MRTKTPNAKATTEATAYSPDKEARLRAAIEKRFPGGSGPTSEILAFLAEFEAGEKGGQA